MNKRSLQNSDNLLCNWYTLFYEKEWEDWKKTQGSFLVRWLKNVSVCVQQQITRGQILWVDCMYQRVLGLCSRKHALCAKALLSLLPSFPPVSVALHSVGAVSHRSNWRQVKNKTWNVTALSFQDAIVFCAASRAQASAGTGGTEGNNLLEQNSAAAEISWQLQLC